MKKKEWVLISIAENKKKELKAYLIGIVHSINSH